MPTAGTPMSAEVSMGALGIITLVPTTMPDIALYW
jgi:hypothetical protein